MPLTNTSGQACWASFMMCEWRFCACLSDDRHSPFSYQGTHACATSVNSTKKKDAAIPTSPERRTVMPSSVLSYRSSAVLASSRKGRSSIPGIYAHDFGSPRIVPSGVGNAASHGKWKAASSTDGRQLTRCAAALPSSSWKSQACETGIPYPLSCLTFRDAKFADTTDLAMPAEAW